MRFVPKTSVPDHWDNLTVHFFDSRQMLMTGRSTIPNRLKRTLLAAALLGLILVKPSMGFEFEAVPQNNTSSAKSKDSDGQLRSGRTVGKSVPSFYVRAVTGPLRNKSVCYVCRNGNRPVVMVLLRRLEPELKQLFQGIDQVVDRNRAVGLRSFGVLINDEPTRVAPRVQTFAFDGKIDTPLTVATGVVASPTCQNVHPQAAVTVVLYRNQRVVTTYAYRAGELKAKQIRDLVQHVRKFIKGDKSAERS